MIIHNTFFAYDETDGFITDNVTIDTKRVDFSREGTYEITYSVVNSHGIDNRKTITITTEENATDDYIYNTNLTDDDWDILEENGYFTYELLDETNEDSDAVIDLVKPISLNITNQSYMASAYIYDITEEYIYAVSVRHAVIVINGNIEIIFFNDEVISTDIEYETLNGVTDLAIFRFRTDSVPKDLLYQLKEAYIDIDHYDNLEIDQPLIVYSENHNYPYNTTQQIKPVTLVSTYTTVTVVPYSDGVLITTRGGRPGMSGCSIIDYQGRVLGTASYISNISNEDYTVRLDRLEELETNLLSGE